VSKRAWIIFIVIIVGLLSALVIWSHNSSPSLNVGSVDVNTIQSASKTNGNIADHVFGKADSKVILTEYGDYQCPGCGSADPGVEKIINEYQDYIGFIFRNYPLTSIHQNALAAAGAAEATGLQGKYWEIHKLLYERQSDWEYTSDADRTAKFVSYATELGLDATKFKSDLSSDSVAQKIKFDQALGNKVGVKSTPTFYINSTIQPESTLQDLQQSKGDKLRDAIDAALVKAGVTPPKR
jgi:protein-disulfide isomerase